MNRKATAIALSDSDISLTLTTEPSQALEFLRSQLIAKAELEERPKLKGIKTVKELLDALEEINADREDVGQPPLHSMNCIAIQQIDVE